MKKRDLLKRLQELLTEKGMCKIETFSGNSKKTKITIPQIRAMVCKSVYGSD